MIIYFNALVICDHGPLALGNSGDFDFSTSYSLLLTPILRGQHAGKTMTILPEFSPQSVMFYLALPCLLRYIKSLTFPPHYGDNAK